MDSVILIAGRIYDAEIDSRLKLLDVANILSECSNWSVDDGTSYVHIRRVDGDLPLASPDLWSPLFDRFPDPVYYTVDFRDMAFCKRVLVAVADDEDLVVDSDFGFVALGSDFVKRILNEPLWDWRSLG